MNDQRPAFTPGMQVRFVPRGTHPGRWGSPPHGVIGTVIAVIPREHDIGPGLRGNNFWGYVIIWANPPSGSFMWGLQHRHLERDLRADDE